ncbi:MAG: YbjN domain-containing protein [Pseudomonadota bacterium]
MIRTLIATVALLIAAPGAAWAEMSAVRIGEILEDSGYAVSEFGSGMVAVTVGDQIVLVGTEGPDADISYIAYIAGLTDENVSLEFLNEFNNSIKFGRVYFDDDGDVVVQYDRNSAGGVTEENVLDDFELFLDLVSVFLSEVADRDIA